MGGSGGQNGEGADGGWGGSKGGTGGTGGGMVKGGDGAWPMQAPTMILSTAVSSRFAMSSATEVIETSFRSRPWSTNGPTSEAVRPLITTVSVGMLPAALDTPRCELGVVAGGLGANSLLAEQLRAKKPRQIHVIDDGFGLGSDGEHSVLRARRPLHARAVPRLSLHFKSTRAKQRKHKQSGKRSWPKKLLPDCATEAQVAEKPQPPGVTSS